MSIKLPLVVAAKTLLVHKNHVLLLRRSKTDPTLPGLWELPGGKLEFGESPQEAALRELAEETGIAGTLGPILYADSIMGTKTKRQFIILLYLATAKQAKVTLSFEHCDYLWATKSQMLQMLAASQLSALKKYSTLENPLIDIAE